VLIREPSHNDDLRNIFGHEAILTIAKRGVVHVGAHKGEEVEQYLSLGFQRIVLIDANPDACKDLVARFAQDKRISIFNYAVCDRIGTVDFHLHTSRSGSTEPASLLRMKRFSEIVGSLHTPATIQVPAITLDALFDEHGLQRSDYNFLNVDIQGAEILALKGATSLLSSMEVVVSEVNLIELYEGGPMEEEIATFLGDHGFAKEHAVYHTLYDENSTFPAWGECLFVRPNASDSPVARLPERGAK
jgi:FkbM family methyltransferase